MKTIWSLLLISLTIFACAPKDDTENYLGEKQAIAEGQELFTSNCSLCHSFVSNGIGPNLSGVTIQNKKSWLSGFIHDPSAYITNKDQHALALLAQYKTPMPSFTHLDENAIDKILAFLNQHQDTTHVAVRAGDIKNPFPDSIMFSAATVQLKHIATIPASSDKELFTRITKMYDNGSGFFVVDIRGKLYFMKDGKTQIYFDIAKERPKFVQEPGLGTGFGSFAFHPEFETNGLLYTTHTEPGGTTKADFSYADSIDVKLQWVLTEWKTDNPGDKTFKGSGRELFRMNVVSGIHGVQEITFNDKAKKGDADYGLLYIGIGDSGCAENNHPELLLNDHVYLGTIFRIDPRGTNSKNGNYAIPATNPFVQDHSEKLPREVYAYGFRNPHRITWLTSGEMLVANIGQRNIESVYKVKAGANHGWPTREGRFMIEWPGDINKIYPLPADDSLLNINYPVVEYDHDEGLAIASIYQYEGKEIPALKGKLVFADIAFGRIFMTDIASLQSGQATHIEELHLKYDGKSVTMLDLIKKARANLRLGKDKNGELYVLCKPDGKIYKMIP